MARNHARVLAQSGLMFAARITRLHFSVSSAISLANSAGDPGIGGAIRSARRARNAVSASAALISWLSFSVTMAGVPLGATRPHQPLASYPDKVSPTVGISDN